MWPDKGTIIIMCLVSGMMFTPWLLFILDGSLKNILICASINTFGLLSLVVLAICYLYDTATDSNKIKKTIQTRDNIKIAIIVLLFGLKFAAELDQEMNPPLERVFPYVDFNEVTNNESLPTYNTPRR